MTHQPYSWSAKSLAIVVLVLSVGLRLEAQAPVVEPTANVSGSGAARVAPSAPATRVQTPPLIDGRLDDAAWAQAAVIDTFTQRDPQEGAPGTEVTEVRIAYDDEAIYVGARLADRGEVTSRLGRRDMPLASSDWLRVSFDTYRDRLIGVRFDVNPAGVRRDATLSASGGGRGGGGTAFGGGDGDLAWDAVWDAATSVDEGGWTAELRIPFSQLRFTPNDEQVWGFQLERIISRTQEYTLFSFTPKSEVSGVPAFGDLTGLRALAPGRPLELVPYVLSEAALVDTGGNAFRSDRELSGNVGLDARYRLTSGLILSATVNPDFGQVEVDPAVINLTAFETRYQERRPFFVEGASNFQFGGNIRGPGANAASLLYSRRVGRAPQVRLAADQADVPGVTDILGAVKISGKTANGWSLGVVNAVASEERGHFLDGSGAQQEAIVEPRTNYLAARLNREFRGGMTTFGGMVTGVHRALSDGAEADVLASRAWAGGVDFTHEWANRSWGVGGFVVGSEIAGTAASLERTQRSSSRYFHRPDSGVLAVDPTATSMSGYAGTVQLRKQSGLHWTGDFWVGAVSPGFEINDAGFLQRSDRLATGGAIRYNERQPGNVLREWDVSVIQNHTKNYDGDWIEKILRFRGSVTFLNYWSLSTGATYERERVDDRLTRGGPLALKPPSWTAQAGIESDPRKAIIGSIQVGLGGDEAGGWDRDVTALVDVRMSPRWNLSVGPSYTRVRRDAQYVSSVADPLMTATFGSRYIFAPLEQTELSLVTRLNYTFTPDLSLEVYLQPLVSDGVYGTPKEFRAPSTYDFAVYGSDIGTIVRDDDRYTIDPDADGPAGAFSVPDRSFTTRSLRGNMVLRWEYRPGSTLYLVWQQERLNRARMDDFRVDRALGSLFEADGNDVLVLKWSYWFNP